MSSNRVVIELEPHSVLPVREARGARLSCLEGALWITEEGNRNDFVVEQGQVHELSGDGEAVVQAMGAARVAMEFGDGIRGRSPNSESFAPLELGLRPRIRS